MKEMVAAESVDGIPAAGGLLLDGEHPGVRQPIGRIHIQRS